MPGKKEEFCYFEKVFFLSDETRTCENLSINGNNLSPNIVFQTQDFYCSISKKMSSLYFGFDVFCQFETKVPEFEAVDTSISVPVQYVGKRLLTPLASDRQNTSNPQYNNDISADLTLIRMAGLAKL
jgi:hypothetical protein